MTSTQWQAGFFAIMGLAIVCLNGYGIIRHPVERRRGILYPRLFSAASGVILMVVCYMYFAGDTLAPGWSRIVIVFLSLAVLLFSILV